MDIALVVDGSSVVTRSDPGDRGRILSFLHDLVSKFDLSSGRARVAAIVFGDVGQVIFSLNTYTTKVLSLILFLMEVCSLTLFSILVIIVDSTRTKKEAELKCNQCTF